MSCLKTNSCTCNECSPGYKADGCKDGTFARCVKYDGPNGNCIPFVQGEYVSSIIKKIDTKFCELSSGIDRYVGVNNTDGNPSYLINKLFNTDTITFSVVNDGGELKVQADINVENVLSLILNNPTLINTLCGGCSALASSTTTLPISTTTIPVTTTTTSTTTLPNNIEVQNFVSGSTIALLTGATGFNLSGGVAYTEEQQGHHNSFSGVLGVTITGSFVGGHLILRRNGIDLQCLNVPSSGVYTFSAFTFILTDIATIEFVAGPCSSTTTSTTSTTTIPATTSTTTSTTTLSQNFFLINDLVDSTVTAIQNVAGFTLGSPVSEGQNAQGHHNGFTSSIGVVITGSPLSGSVQLIVNGSLVECLDVLGAGTFLFGSMTFLLSDEITIQLDGTACIPPTTTTSTTTLAGVTTGLVYFGSNLTGTAPDETEILTGTSVTRDVATDVPLNWGVTSPTPIFYWFWIPNLSPGALKNTWFESVFNQGTMISPSDLFDVPGTITVSGQSGYIYITTFATQFVNNNYIFGN